jgi:hypothetical protein
MLREASALWLTTLRADGSPHTTPVWFVYLDERVWIATGERNTKVSNIVGDDRVSMAVDGTAPSPLVGEGRVLMHAVESAPGRVREGLAAKYDGWDVRDPSPDGRRVILEVVVERWLLAP